MVHPLSNDQPSGLGGRHAEEPRRAVARSGPAMRRLEKALVLLACGILMTAYGAVVLCVIGLGGGPAQDERRPAFRDSGAYPR